MAIHVRCAAGAGALHVRDQRESHLAADGFPCPRPLLEPTPLGQGYATVEELVDEGDAADAHRPVIRQAMATTLARLVISARPLRDIAGLRPGSLTLLSPGSPWPVPHSPIFDFDATAVGAEWIDQVATEARETLARSAGDMVIGHGDWSAQNVRFVGEHLRVVYDWDSLTRDQETTIVAQAATTFPMNWLLPDPPVAPSQMEAHAFVAEYEEARGAGFTGAEWDGLAAAATYALAYSARLEHSLHPELTDFPPGGGRARLAEFESSFLRR